MKPASRRSPLLFVVGAVAGAIGVSLLAPQDTTEPATGPAAGSRALFDQSGIGFGRSVDDEASADVESAPDALARRMLDDPAGALRAALELPSSPARSRTVRELVLTWADLDPEGFLAYAASADDIESLKPGLRLLVPTDPARVFEISARLSMDGQLTRGSNLVQMAAIRALTSREPAAAAELVTTTASEEAQYNLLRTVASQWGRDDPDAALAWVGTLSVSPAVVRAVEDALIAGITVGDFDRGFALYSERNSNGSFLWAEMVGQLVDDPETTASAATRLLDLRDGQGEQLLFNLVTRWASRDPDLVVDWMLDNTSRIDPSLARAVALSFASSDLDLALDQIDRLTPSLREAWVVQVARPYAERDPAAALEWIEQYRGRPFYGDAYTQAMMEAAQSHPDFAMQQFSSLTETLQVAAAPQIAGALVQRDIEAAADWVSRLQGAARDSQAVNSVVNAWVRRDPVATERWLLGLPAGAMRDNGVIVLLSNYSRADLDVLRLVEEVESAELIPDARIRGAYALRDSDPDRARALVEPYLEEAGDVGRRARSFAESLAE